MAGYFKVYREQVNDALLQNPVMLQVWIFLCRQARYQPTVQDGIELQPGQLLISEKEIAQVCNQTPDKVKYILRCLIQQNLIRRDNIRYRCSLITILTPDEPSEPQTEPAFTPAPKPTVTTPPAPPVKYPARKQNGPSPAVLKQDLPDTPASYDLERAEYLARTTVPKVKKRKRTGM